MSIDIGSLRFDHADYDAASDVLYLHVGEPQSGEGEETPEGHVVRYAPGTGRVVGLTLLGVRHTLTDDGDDGHRADDREDDRRAACPLALALCSESA